MKAGQIFKGNWSTRWGNWVVSMRWYLTGWAVTVYRWPPGTDLVDRTQIAYKSEGLLTVDDAVTWACDEMVKDGARIFVLDAPPNLALKRILSFTPAPEAVA